MDIAQVVSGSITGIIAILLGVYVSFTARCKGPILSNSYIFASKDERKRIDVKVEYKLITVIFGCLSGIFALLSLYIFTQFKWLYVLMWILIVFVIVYAIVDTVRTDITKKP